MSMPLRNSKATAGAAALGNLSMSKSSETDEAWNYFLGLDYAPIKDLNIALTYMSNTPLNFKADTKDITTPLGANSILRSVGWTDGTHEREDLPGYLAVGRILLHHPGHAADRAELDLLLRETGQV